MRRDPNAHSSFVRLVSRPLHRGAGRALAALAAGSLLAMGVSGCAKAQLQGDSSSYLILDSLEAASGATPSQFSGTLASDVITNVKSTDASGATVLVPTVFEDPGQAAFTLALKDPGGETTPTTPTTANLITITQYHIQYVRSDGQNTAGVDVPYPVDGAVTVTVGAQGSTAGFTMVEAVAKQEAPLKALDSNGNIISTVAQVTFYGTDQTGHAVSVTGQMDVDFSNWGDPQ